MTVCQMRQLDGEEIEEKKKRSIVGEKNIGNL